MGREEGGVREWKKRGKKKGAIELREKRGRVDGMEGG